MAREASSETILRQSLANLQTYIDNKFASLTSTITLDATEYVSKQQKYCAYDFKFKGNKDQFNLNQELIDSLQETLVAPQVDTFLKVVQSTIDSLKSRNKQIKLADNSEAGWDLVTEYKVSGDAADSDDDKRTTKGQRKGYPKEKGSQK